MFADLSDEVSAAISSGKPVVALESSPIAFGWEPQRALDVARRTLEAVRMHGAVPAVFWIRAGRIMVGSPADELTAIAGNTSVTRTSRANLAYALTSRGLGVTTISATMLMAYGLGIRFLSVGGLGGVHIGAFGTRGTLDVSQDIDELARTPMIVVNSGPKTILDIRGTLEMLETRGVALASLGIRDVPGYFVRESGYRAPATVSSLEEAAELVTTHLALESSASLLLCVPVPAADALPADTVFEAVRGALAEIKRKRIHGGAVTSAILRHIAESTGGNTVDALESLTIHNAEVAAEIAVRTSNRMV